jgi:enoyl-CoA hydratase/carnithine racemase
MTVADAAQAGRIVVTDADGVRDILFDRPAKKNAFTAALYGDLADAIAGASGGSDIGALLLRGAGGVFTAGNDIGDFLRSPPTAPDAPVRRFLEALALCDKPLVAAVSGMAVGVGTTMLLHCDMVYAAPDAVFRTPFVDLGLVPEAASSLLLPALVGPARASRMLLMGEAIDAATALDWGLVGAVVPADALEATSRAAATALARKPRHAVIETKRLLRHGREAVLDTMEREFVVFAERLRSPEARAAFDAFLKR